MISPLLKLKALTHTVSKVTENTSLKKRQYLANKVLSLGYEHNQNVQHWWNAAWGKVAEKETAILEIWHLSNTLPCVDIKIVRSIGLLRSALNPKGSPKGKEISPYNENIITWCYSAQDLSPSDRAHILSAITIPLVKDLYLNHGEETSLYQCWEKAWPTLKSNKKLPDTVWKWLGPTIFNDSPSAMGYLSSQIPMIPVLDSILQPQPEITELPLLWKPYATIC